MSRFEGDIKNFGGLILMQSSGLELRVQGLIRVQGLGLRVQGLGFRAGCPEIRERSLGCRV